jgi:hypothetical protein
MGGKAMASGTQLAANSVNDDGGTVAISDLIALFQMVKGARASLAGALALDGGVSPGAPSDLKAAMMREELALMDERLKEIAGEIQSASVYTRFDAIQKLRFRLIEFGDEPASAEIAINDYTQSRMLLPVYPKESLAARISHLERNLALAALAISCRDENSRHANLRELVHQAIDDLSEIKEEVLTA